MSRTEKWRLTSYYARRELARTRPAAAAYLLSNAPASEKLRARARKYHARGASVDKVRALLHEIEEEIANDPDV